MDIKENKNRPIWASIYAILFLLLFILVKINSPIVHDIDNFIRSLVFPFTSQGLTMVANFLTNIGAPIPSLIYSCLILAFIFFKREYVTAIWGFSTLVIGNGLAVVFKHLAQRPRPALADRLAPAHGYSFPSGHTFATMMFVLLFIYLIIPRIKVQFVRTALKFIAIAWVVIITLTRIYLRVHFPTDTIGSLLLAGAVWDFALMIWLRFFQSKITDPHTNGKHF